MNDGQKKPLNNKNNNTKTIYVKSTTLTHDSKLKENCYTEVLNDKEKLTNFKKDLHINKLKKSENENSLNLSKNTSSLIPKNTEELDNIKNLVKLTVNGVNEALKKTDQSLSKEKFSCTVGKFMGKKENVDTSLNKTSKNIKSKETSIKKNNISLSKAITDNKPVKKSFNNNGSNKNFVKCYTYRKEIELDIDKLDTSKQNINLKRLKNPSKERQNSTNLKERYNNDMEVTINSNHSQSKKKSNFGYVSQNQSTSINNINFINSINAKEKQYLGADLVEIKELINDSQEFMKVDSDDNLLDALKSGNENENYNNNLNNNEIQSSIDCVSLSHINKFTHDNKNDKNDNDIVKQISNIESKTKKRLSSQVVGSLLNSSQGYKKGTSIVKNKQNNSNLNTSNIVKSKLNERKKENIVMSKKSSSDLFLNMSVNQPLKNVNDKLENILSKTSNNSFLKKATVQDSSSSKNKQYNNSKIKCPTEVPKQLNSKFKTSEYSNDMLINRKIMDKFSSKEKDKIVRISNDKIKNNKNTNEKSIENTRKIKGENNFTPIRNNSNSINIKTFKNSFTPLDLAKNNELKDKENELMDSTEEILSQLELTAKKSVVNSSDIVKIINNYKLIQLRDIIDKISFLNTEISNNSYTQNSNKKTDINEYNNEETECNLEIVLNKLYKNDKEEVKEDNNSPKFVDLEKMSKLKKKSIANQVNEMISHLNKTVDIYNKLSKEINN